MIQVREIQLGKRDRHVRSFNVDVDRVGLLKLPRSGPAHCCERVAAYINLRGYGYREFDGYRVSDSVGGTSGNCQKDANKCPGAFSWRRYPDFDGVAWIDDCAVGGRVDLEQLLSFRVGMASRLTTWVYRMGLWVVEIAERFLFGRVTLRCRGFLLALLAGQVAQRLGNSNCSKNDYQAACKYFSPDSTGSHGVSNLRTNVQVLVALKKLPSYFGACHCVTKSEENGR